MSQVTRSQLDNEPGQGRRKPPRQSYCQWNLSGTCPIMPMLLVNVTTVAGCGEAPARRAALIRSSGACGSVGGNPLSLRWVQNATPPCRTCARPRCAQPLHARRRRPCGLSHEASDNILLRGCTFQSTKTDSTCTKALHACCAVLRCVFHAPVKLQDLYVLRSGHSFV